MSSSSEPHVVEDCRGVVQVLSDGTVRRSAGAPPFAVEIPEDECGVEWKDVAWTRDHGGLNARLYRPRHLGAANDARLPVLAYFHGGGFCFGSGRWPCFHAVCLRLAAELPALVASFDYRLAPEHRCPAAYDDGVDVLRYLASTGLPGISVPVDFSRCFLAGDSAGGNIAHHVARRWTASTTSSESPPPSNPIRLAGIILVQPYFGGEQRTDTELRLDGKAPVLTMRGSDWAWTAFLPEGADRNHPAAHVTDENAGLDDGFPPAMVVIGGLDLLQDWQRRYADVLRRKGKAVRVVEYPEAIHTFYLFPVLPDSGRLVEEMKAFMEESNASELTT